MSRQRQDRRLAALSAIAGTLITVGMTVTAGGTLYYSFQSQTDPFTTSSSIEVRNLNAIRDGDELRVTAVLKNTGQTSINKVLIDEISVSDITIKQNEDGIITLKGSKSTSGATHCLSGGTCNNATLTKQSARGFSVMGDSITDSTLEGGRSNAFVIEIECGNTICGADISNEVNISDRLTITLLYTSGDDTLLTNAYSTRVQPG